MLDEMQRQVPVRNAITNKDVCPTMFQYPSCEQHQYTTEITCNYIDENTGAITTNAPPTCNVFGTNMPYGAAVQQAIQTLPEEAYSHGYTGQQCEGAVRGLMSSVNYKVAGGSQTVCTTCNFCAPTTCKCMIQQATGESVTC